MTANATATASSLATLAGIPLLVAEPGEYERQLAECCARQFPGLHRVLPSRVDGGATAPGGRYEAVLRLWSSPWLLKSLLYRDWLESENETDELGAYLVKNGIFEGHDRVAIPASGLGGLVRTAHAAGATAATCYDLSWPALYCSRLLLANQSEGLPEELVGPLTRYVVASTGRGFERTTVPAHLARVAFRPSFETRFVTTSFYAKTQFDGSLILLCNSLGDLVNRPSLMLQLMRSQAPHQTLVIVNWLGQRDALDEMSALIERAGGRITWADFVSLPYASQGPVLRQRVEFLNFSVRIERDRPVDDGDLIMSLSAEAAALAPFRAGEPVRLAGGVHLLDADERALVSDITASGGARVLGRRDAAPLPWTDEQTLASLIARGVVELRLK